MTDIKQDELHKIHMKMLAKSENAKDIGDYTVIKLGFAVSIARELINTEVTAVLERVITSGIVHMETMKDSRGHSRQVITTKHLGDAITAEKEKYS